jgi:hypothetical protein
VQNTSTVCNLIASLHCSILLSTLKNVYTNVNRVVVNRWANRIFEELSNDQLSD